MQNTRLLKKHAIYPLLILLFLLISVAFSLDQTKRSQDLRTKAAGTNDCTVNADLLTAKPPEQELFDLVNEYRVQNGIPPMSWNDTLKKASAWMSYDMSRNQQTSHVDSFNRAPNVRLFDCGFTSSTVGENLASGSPSANQILSAWKASPSHNVLLLNAAFTQAAVSYILDNGTANAYWTMNMGGSDTGAVITPPVGTNVIPSVETVVTPTLSSDVPTPTTAKVGVNIQIAVKVKISGLGKVGNITPKRLTRKIYARVFGSDNIIAATGNAFLSYDGGDYFTGTINLGRMNEDAYLVKFSSDNSLEAFARPEFQKLLVDKVNQIPPVTLYQGDLSRDNVLNLADYNLALPCFQDKKCDTQNEIDFNDDGTTDVKDYNLLLRSFGQYPGN